MIDDDVARVRVGDLEIAYETFGDPSGRPLLLIMGFASQMLSWPDEFCSGLAERGHYVVRFDNRDVGLSTHLHDAPTPDLVAAFAGDFSSAAYHLSDMAGDAAGLLDALGIDSAHVVGVSLGGMIAQTLAIERPDRIRSLTSIMSTTGDPTVGRPSAVAMQVLLAPPARNRAQAIEKSLAAYRVIGSPGIPLDEDRIREIAGRSFDRANDPVGAMRQLMAVLASGDRTVALRGLVVPTLVIHGADDPMIDVSGGRASADAIPNAELFIVDGMGHDLSRNVLLPLVEQVSKFAAKAEAGRHR